MSTRSQETTLEPPAVRWVDADIQPEKSNSSEKSAVDGSGFMTRQMRRLSEHPKINQIQLARKSSKHNITFLRKAITIIASSTLFKILFVLLRAIPISKIIMSVVFYDKCQAENFIILYLMIGGVASCIQELGQLFLKKCLSADCVAEFEISLTLIALSYTLAEFVWFIVGSVYVFKTYGNYQSLRNQDVDYCHFGLYTYAFVVTVISYILLFLVVFISCCAMCLARMSDKSRMKKHKSSHEDIAES